MYRTEKFETLAYPAKAPTSIVVQKYHMSYVIMAHGPVKDLAIVHTPKQVAVVDDTTAITRQRHDLFSIVQPPYLQ